MYVDDKAVWFTILNELTRQGLNIDDVLIAADKARKSFNETFNSQEIS